MSAQPLRAVPNPVFVEIARFAVVPAVVVCAALAMAVLVVPPDSPLMADELAAEASAAPTPYSEAHARVQARPGQPEEQPPTF